MQLSKNTKLTKVAAAAVSAGTAVTSDAVDMQGFEGVMFFGSIATANAGNFAKARQDSASNMGAAADLEGTKNVTGDDADSFLIDVYRPRERYVDCQVVRAGANTATGDIYALQYGPLRKAPTSQGATVDAEAHVSPAEGTA